MIRPIRRLVELGLKAKKAAFSSIFPYVLSSTR
jgi:hypothetical protein